MPLESASFINGLDANNPAGGDSLSQADDHLRLIKSSIKATFPSVTGAVTATHTQLNQLTSIDFATYVTLTGVQTLTNKTLTAPTISSPTVTGTLTTAALTASGAVTFNSNLSVIGSASAGAGITATAAGFQPLLLNRTGADSVLHIAFQNSGVTRGWLGANSTYPFFASTGGGGACVYADAAGNFAAVGNITAYSDARLKTDVSTIEDALETVKSLRGVNYTRIDSGDRRVGVIAQEVQAVLPQVVLPGAEDGILTVSYGDMVGVLIEAIKELSAKVTELETRIVP